MFEELNDDFVANREIFTKTLSLQPADRADLLAARARKTKLSYARRSPAHHARVSPEARRGAFGDPRRHRLPEGPPGTSREWDDAS